MEIERAFGEDQQKHAFTIPLGGGMHGNCSFGLDGGWGLRHHRAIVLW